MKKTLALLLTTTALWGCSDAPTEQVSTPHSPEAVLSLEYQKFTLGNGLDVIFHVDRSDPVVAIDLAVHVGSGREVTGRTGFAHLFEHLLFLDSENLGYGGLDEMNTRIGGEGTNGFTTHDMTQYFQAVPADALEKIIWAEADKLGWFIKTVSQNVIDNEKQVVKNEKRQRVDNQPYGHNFYVINKALYPDDHPYNWQVIGSLADLDAATLKDTQDFFARWYVPNNVTVTLTGDFDPAEAKTLMEKYFGEIPRGGDIADMTPRPGQLTDIVNLYHEDNFATVPQLTRVWPTVESYHPDSYALDILMSYLSEGKTAPLNEVLIDEEKLTSSVTMFNYTKEVSGEAYLFVTANAGEDIDGLSEPLALAFAQFELTGISDADLDRIKTRMEVEAYGQIDSALGKAIQMGEYNLFTGDPGYFSTEIERLRSVTPDDVMRVYNTYIKDKPYITTSFVPKGALELALEGAVRADVVEEPIVQGEGAPVDFDPAARVIENPTPSSFDRSIEPDFGAAYTLPTPQVERATLDNGLEVYGLISGETPLVNFTLKLDAGRNRGDVAKPAVAALTADMLEKGTVNKTTAEFENAVRSLGSSLSVSVGETGVFVTGTALRRNLVPTLELAREMLAEPRWDSEEFALLKAKRLQEITQAEGDPNAIATREMARLKYPEDHIFHYTTYGTSEKLETIELDDLKAFYQSYYRLEGGQLRIVGDYPSLSEGGTDTLGAVLEAALGVGDPVAPVTLPQARNVETAQIYFYDVPGAKQSVLRLDRPSLTARDADYALAEAVNFPLGGIYTSKLNTELRVNKGYTYGIRSGFNGQEDRGAFSVRSSVRTNVTLESLELIRDILANYGPDFTEDELTIMKAALLRGQALENETLRDKLGMLGDIGAYGYAEDYKSANAARIEAMTLDEVKALASRYIRPDAMTYLVVGDAATQMARLEALGFGEAVLLNPPN